MKKALLSIFTALLLSSCYNGKVKGRKFKLEQKCITSHLEAVTDIMAINGKLLPVVRLVNVCDSVKIDTIWSGHKKIYRS